MLVHCIVHNKSTKMLLLRSERCKGVYNNTLFNGIREDPRSHTRTKTMHDNQLFFASSVVYLLFSFVLVHFANSMRSVYVPMNAFSNTKTEKESVTYKRELPTHYSAIYTHSKRGEITFYQLHHKCIRTSPISSF